MLEKKRVLFVAECVTLAHMARPAKLAETLDPDLYEIFFASNGRFDELFDPLPGRPEKIYSIGNDHFLEALAKGEPLYDERTLLRYVEDDLALLERVRPDVVVGDFRLSLSVSARVAGIPYATISNVYWSPFAIQRYPVPDLPLTRAIGVSGAQAVFNLVRPLVFALHTRPLNSVRRRYGLDTLGLDLRKVYTDADLTLYADVPGLVKTSVLPVNHRFVGPVLWSPNVALPAWWDQIDNSEPVIYLTPGSSGSAEQFASMAAALSSLPATVLVATAGKMRRNFDSSSRVHVAEFLPGDQAVSRADLVVCNGGSPTTTQALSAGKPVLGIPSNLDQHLNMQAIERIGVGVSLRSEIVDPSGLVSAANTILKNLLVKERAKQFQVSIDQLRTKNLFVEAMATWE